MQPATKTDSSLGQQPPMRGTSSALAGLGNRFVALVAKRLPRLEFASEVGRSVLEAMRVTAVAVLGYETRRERLVLLAAEGLNTEAIAALGGGEACIWDIPSRSLRNHRISIITGAHKNPFVPRALAEVSRLGLTIVAVPVLQNEQPAGVVLLFASGKRSFSDADLYTLSQALLVCAPVLRDTEGTGSQAQSVSLEDGKVQEALAKLAAAGAIIDPGATQSRPAAEPLPQPPRWQDHPVETTPSLAVEFEAERRRWEEQVASLRQELEAATTRLRQLTLQNHSLVRERDDLVQRLHVQEAEKAAEVMRLQAELDALQDRVVAAEAERTRTARLADSRVQALQQSLANLQKEWESLRSQSGGVETQLAEWQTLALAVFEERDRLVAQIESLHAQRRALEEQLTQLRHGVEQDHAALVADRDAWKAEAAEARRQLAERIKVLNRLEAEVHTVALQRDSLSEQLQQLRAELERVGRIAEEAHAQYADSETARAAAMAENQVLRDTLEQERQRAAEIAEALRAELASEHAQVESLAHLVDTLRSQVAHQERLVEESQHAWETLHNQWGAAERELERIRAELEASDAGRAEAELRLAQAEEVRAAAAQERQALREEIAGLRRQLVDLEAARAALGAQLGAQESAARRELEQARAQAAAWQQQAENTAEELRQLQAEWQRATAATATLQTAVAELRERLADSLAERERLAHELAQREALVRATDQARQALELQFEEHRERAQEERTFWQNQVNQAAEERAQLVAKLVEREQALQLAERQRVQLAAELSELQHEQERWRQQAAGLEQALAAMETELAAAREESARSRLAATEERNHAQVLERALRAELAALRSDAEATAGQLERLQEQYAATEKARQLREQETDTLRRELAELRRQLADRALLAAQAESLGARVVELEEELAAARAEAARAQDRSASEWEERVLALERELARVRGEAASAERARAGLAEELMVARNLLAQTQVGADRKLATLRETIDRLEQERRRLEEALTRQAVEQETQANLLSATQSELEQRTHERDHARQAAAELEQRLRDGTQELRALTERLRTLEQEVERLRAERSRQLLDLERLEAERAEAERVAANLRAELEAATQQWRADRSALEDQLQMLERQLHEARAVHSERYQEASELRALLEHWQAQAAAAERDRTAALQQAQESERTARELRARLEAELAASSQRVADLQAQLRAALERLQSSDGALEDLRRQLAAREQAVTEALQACTRWQEEVAQLELARRTLLDEQQRLQAELEAARASQGEQVQVLSRELQRLRTEYRALQQEKHLLEGALAEHQKRTRDLAQAHAASVGELQGLTEHLRKQIAELNQGRAQLHERLERSERELESWREEAQRRSIEQASLLERLRTATEQLAASEQRQQALEDELKQLRADAQALRNQFADQQTRAAEAEQAHARIAALEEELAFVRGDLSRSERQRQLLEEDRARMQAERAELLAQLEREQVRLQEQLAQLASERRRVEELLAEQQQALEQQRNVAAELRQQYEQLQVEKLAAEGERVELTETLAAAQEKLRELEVKLEERERALAQAEQERHELLDALRAAQEAAGRAVLTQGQAKRAGVVTVGPRELEQLAARQLKSERIPPPEVAPAAGEVRAEAVRELVLLDGGRRAEEASAALRSAGFEVRAMAPNEESLRELPTAGSGCVLVNLGAGPLAWKSLLRLRSEDQWHAWRVLAYVMPPSGDKGFCFARAEFDLWPTDAQRLLASLGWLRPKLKKLLAVSSDVDGMNNLREPLTRAGISTSIVLDGKQALEFTSIVSPEAAVLHLSPATSGVGRAIATLRQQEATAELPLLLVLDPAPPREEHFYAVTVRELLFKGTFTFKNLPSALAALLA